MNKIFNLNLDIRKNNYICLSDFKIGDNLSTIYGHMLQNSVAYDLTGLTLRVNFKDSQGNLYFQDSSKGVSIVNPAEGTFKIDVLSSVLSVEGIIKADISIFKGTQKLTSSTFSMEVVETVYKNGAIIGANGKDLLQEVVEGEAKRITSELKREESEVVREKGEAKRESHEIIRESNEIIRKTGYSKMDSRIDNLVLGQGSNTEVIDARVDSIACKTYPTLKARLDDTSTQLTNNALTTLTTSNAITSLNNATDGIMQIDSIKGRTLQNLCSGDFINKTNSPQVEVSKNKIIFKKAIGTTSSYRAITLIPQGKVGTEYTLLCNVSGLDGVANKLPLDAYSHASYGTGINVQSIYLVNGFNTIKFSSKPNFEFTPMLFFNLGNVPDLTKDVTIENIILLEGDYTSNPPSFFEGIKSTGEFEGRNLFDKTKITSGYFLKGLDGVASPNSTGYYSDYIKVMPNSSYTISVGIGSEIYGHCFYDSSKKFISGIISSPSGKQTVITPSNAMYIRLSSLVANVDNQQLEEGGEATQYVPYEDYKIEVLSHGKNLIDNGINAWDKIILTNGYLSLTNDTTAKAKSIYYRVKEGESYSFSVTGYTVGGNQSDYKSINVAFINIASPDIKLETKVISYKEITTPTTITMGNIVAPTGATHAYIYPISQNGTLYFKNVQLEEGKTSTPYEPYAEDKITIQLKEPLHGLLNGVSDEIIGDRIYRRVGKDVLNGVDTWVLSSRTGTVIAFYKNKPDAKKGGQCICDNFSFNYDDTKEGMYVSSTSLMVVNILKSKLSTPDVVGFKKWLSENPTEIYYELAEPITTTINPSSLKSFKDGSIILNNSITPTVDLKYPTSVSGRISTIENELDNAVDRTQKLEEALFLVTTKLIESREVKEANLSYKGGASGISTIYKNNQFVNLNMDIDFELTSGQELSPYATVPIGFRPIKNIITTGTDKTGVIQFIIEIKPNGELSVAKRGSITTNKVLANINYMTKEI